MTNREQRRAAEQGKTKPPADKSRPIDAPLDAPREEEPRGEVVHDTEGAGAPSGGQRDGRQGDQQGIRY